MQTPGSPRSGSASRGDWAGDEPRSDRRFAQSSTSDLLIRQGDQFFATSAHLNGDVAQRRAVETQPGRLMMIRAPHVLNPARGPLLELLNLVGCDLLHQIILSPNCSDGGVA